MKPLLSIPLALTCLAAFTSGVFSDETSKKHLITLDDYRQTFSKVKHPCNRRCIKGEPPRICKYSFMVEEYYSMSKACHNCPLNRTDCFRKDCVPAGGYGRPIVTVNRTMPGPSIEVCLNDVIVVDVNNEMMVKTTTIHWHGLHQKHTPYMDGVPFITQCPISPKSSFRYTFRATEAGTNFWHAHTMDRVDGCYGALIVRVPEETSKNVSLYDYDLSEHIIQTVDWNNITGMDQFLFHYHSSGSNAPNAILINGMGRYNEFNDGQNQTRYTPLARFMVEQGYRYRLRIICPGYLICPMELTVDNHTFTLISTDGFDVQPVEAETLTIFAGERYDVVLNADKPIDLYWIRVRGLLQCGAGFAEAYQLAVLEYKSNATVGSLSNLSEEILPVGTPTYNNSVRTGMQINPLNMGTESNRTFITLPELSSVQSIDSQLASEPDVQLYVGYGFYFLDNPNFHRPGYLQAEVDQSVQSITPQFNHVSFRMPSFSLLSQRFEIPENYFCNQTSIEGIDCVTNFCTCTYVLQIPLNANVELVLVDEGTFLNLSHPIHIHGLAFHVVAMQRLGANTTVGMVKQLDEANLVKRNLKSPPLKDTVAVPDGGFVMLRFKADNPGYWFMHCHFEFHSDIGMALVLKIGEDNEMPPIPKDFPRCGSYTPKITTGN